MKYNKIINALAVSLAAFVACEQIPQEQEAPMTGPDTVIARIQDGKTKTYLGADKVSTYWSAGDKIGLFTEEGGNNFEFVTSTQAHADKGIFTGNMEEGTPAYGYYPYSETATDYTAIKMHLASEQDAKAIGAYDFKASNSITMGKNGEYELGFTGVMTMLSVEINATETPMASSTLKSVTLKVSPPLRSDAAPAVTGDFVLDLRDKSVKFEGTTADYAKLVWDEPYPLSGGKATASIFVNPSSIVAGSQLHVTIETYDGATATTTFTAAKACQPNTAYEFEMYLHALNGSITYGGNPISSFKFVNSLNTKLIKSSYYTAGANHKGQNYTNSTTSYDIVCTYDEDKCLWEGEIPYLYDFSDLIASFETTEEGAKVYVGGVEQVSGQTANDFNSVITYVVENPDGSKGWTKVSLRNTGLPIVTVTGKDGQAPYAKATDFDDIEGTFTVNIDGVDYSAGVRLRGNTTQEFPKKPYAIKLDKKASILGMPTHKRWVLLANWLDRTMLRNDLAFYLAQQTGVWTPHGTPVEVVLNGVHVGNYWLGEQIKIDENRVNIADYGWEDLIEEIPSPTYQDIADNIGFLLECDQSTDDSEIYFKTTSPVPFYVYIKDPSDAATSTGEGVGTNMAYDYIKDYFNTVGSSLKSSDWNTVRKMLNYESFAKHWIFTEVTENQESKHPKSFYMHKDAGGKLCAGPAWDYDWGTFVAMENLSNSQVFEQSSDAGKVKDGYTAKYTMWYTYLFNDPEFVAVVKDAWNELSSKFAMGVYHLDNQAQFVKASDIYNHAMWPCTGSGQLFWIRYPNFDEKLTFDEAIAQMRTNLEARLQWLDTQISAM